MARPPAQKPVAGRGHRFGRQRLRHGTVRPADGGQFGKRYGRASCCHKQALISGRTASRDTKGQAMGRSSHWHIARELTAEHPVAVIGREWIRYGLVVVIAWMVALEYTAYEAWVIRPLITHSPLMSWFYNILSVRALSATLGTLQIIAALLIPVR